MKLRAAVIGLGVGQAHLEALLAHPAVEVTGACDFDEERLGEMRRQYPAVKRWTLDAESLLNDPNVDLAVLATWDNFHHNQVVQGLHAGKHLFVEKPLCQTEQEAEEIRLLLQSRPELKLSSNFILRRYPRFLEMKRAAHDGRLGELYLLEGDYNYGRLEKITGSWRGEIPLYSVMMGGGLHLIDALQWISGRKVQRVAAFGTNIASRNTQFRFDDTITAVLQMDGGIIAKIAANFGCVYPHFHKVCLYGTSGTLESSPDHLRYWRSRSESDPPSIVDVEGTKPLKGVLLHDFVEHILGRGPNPVTPSEVFSSLAVAFAIDRACSRKECIAVEED